MPILVARFVDDLRIVNNTAISIEQDEQVLNLQLHTLKLVLEQLGMKIHSKPGKLIPATQTIEWIGWSISTTSLRISLTGAKRLRALSLCSDLLDRHLSQERITARMVMSCAGFLNFVTSVIRQGRPFLRSLYQDLAKCQVFAAWQSGRRRFDPDITLSSAAVQDLTWWCIALRTPLYRPLQVAGGKIFIWHQKHPDFSHLFQLAWAEGLVVVIHTDASGDGGWGVACGNLWKQGKWTPAELQHSINRKELEA